MSEQGDDVLEPEVATEDRDGGRYECARVFVGQGLTFRMGTEVYPATIVEVAEDGSRILFQQDTPVRPKGVYFGHAFLFKRACAITQKLAARRDGEQFLFEWTGEEIELGVRRCFTTPVLRPEQYPRMQRTQKHE